MLSKNTLVLCVISKKSVTESFFRTAFNKK